MHSPMEHLAFVHYADRVAPRKAIEMTYGVRRLATPPVVSLTPRQQRSVLRKARRMLHRAEGGRR